MPAMAWYQDAIFSYHGCRCSGKALRSHFATDTLLAGCGDSVILICMCYTSQIDVVEDAGEADALADHLDAMFTPDAPPLQWDAAGEYTRARLELYYLAHAAAPLGLNALSEVRFLLGSLVVHQKLVAYRIASRVRGSTLPLWYWIMVCDDDAAIWSCSSSHTKPAPLGLGCIVRGALPFLCTFNSCTVWGELPGSCRRHHRLRRAKPFSSNEIAWSCACLRTPLLRWTGMRLTEVLVMLGDELLSKWVVVLGYLAQGLLLHKPGNHLR